MILQSRCQLELQAVEGFNGARGPTSKMATHTAPLSQASSVSSRHGSWRTPRASDARMSKAQAAVLYVLAWEVIHHHGIFHSNPLTPQVSPAQCGGGPHVGLVTRRQPFGGLSWKLATPGGKYPKQPGTVKMRWRIWSENFIRNICFPNGYRESKRKKSNNRFLYLECGSSIN